MLPQESKLRRKFFKIYIKPKKSGWTACPNSLTVNWINHKANRLVFYTMFTLLKLRIQLLALFVAAMAILPIYRCQAEWIAFKLNPELRQGEVRVCLLRAGPLISTNGESGFEVIYAIEIPKQGAFSDLKIDNFDEIALFVRGKAIDVSGASSSGSMRFEDLPGFGQLTKPVTPEGRALITTEVNFPKLKIDSEEIDIRVVFTWRGEKLKFDFKRVRVKAPTIAKT